MGGRGSTLNAGRAAAAMGRSDRGGEREAFFSMRGVDITMRGGDRADYYFKTVNGQNYYQRGINGIPQETPQNMDYSEFIERAKANGAIIRRMSTEDKRQRWESYEKDRTETNAFLDRETANNRIMSSGSRADRTRNRAANR